MPILGSQPFKFSEYRAAIVIAASNDKIENKNAALPIALAWANVSAPLGIGRSGWFNESISLSKTSLKAFHAPMNVATQHACSRTKTDSVVVNSVFTIKAPTTTVDAPTSVLPPRSSCHTGWAIVVCPAQTILESTPWLLSVQNHLGVDRKATRCRHCI